MTLDVTIGEAVIEDYDDDEHLTVYVGVQECPKAKKDICGQGKKRLTVWPREAYRSGSTGFWEFFRKNNALCKLYERWRENPESNDCDVARIKPVLKAVLSIKRGSFKTELDKDRLKWLQYWCKKAVRLYGKNAAIQFS